MIGSFTIKAAAATVVLTACLGLGCGGESNGGNPKETIGHAPDVKLYPVENCQLVPAVGGDLVSFSLRASNVGNTELDSVVTVRTEASSGLFNALGVGLRRFESLSFPTAVAITGQEYGQQQRYTVKADPDDAIAELDESNNETTVLVDFRSAPPATEARLDCESPAP